jgi:uncharacterized protein YutE (UPF0331/DUF86 family)
MVNQERLIKTVEDMTETIKNLDECVKVLKTTPFNDTTIFIEFGLKQIFVEFYITVESLTSLLLKDLKKFKVGIDMIEATQILHNNKVIDDDLAKFLNQVRLLRNRIAHRYTEPKIEELLKFISSNKYNFKKILKISKDYIE